MADKNFKVKNGLEVGDHDIVTPDGVITLPNGTKTLAPTDSPTFTGTVGLPSTTALDSPALSGTPTAPTAAVETSTTQVATTAFVNAEIANDAVLKAEVNASNGVAGLDGSAKIAIAQLPNISINAQAGSYTLALADAEKLVEMGSGSAQTLTVPPNSSVAFPVGTKIDVIQTDAGETTIAAGSGVTINSEGSKLKINAQWEAVTLIQRATDTWVLVGALKA